MDILVGSLAVGIGIFHLRWEQVLHSLVAIHGVAFHLTGLEDTQFVHHFRIGTVDEAGVQVGGHCVDGDPGSQFTLLLNTIAGTDEIQTSPAEEFVERIGVGDVDGPASLMALIGRHVAASGFRVGLGIWIRSVCNTVINLRLFFVFFFNFSLSLFLRIFVKIFQFLAQSVAQSCPSSPELNTF
jgi:hypothetical protein